MNEYPTTRPRLALTDTSTVPLVRDREDWYFLANYYAWCARKGFPPGGRDPLTGRTWPVVAGHLARRMGRAAHIALAREAYAIARTFGPSPLP